MNPIPDPHELAGEYVLGTLSAARRREVEQALVHDETLRAAVRYWEERLLPLASLAEPVTPSAALWTRIERSTAPPARVTTPWWNRLNLWRALAAGGLAAAAIMAVVVGVRVDAPPSYMVVLAQPQSMAPGWIVKVSDRRTLRLEQLARTAVPPQKALQLWTKADGWKGPVSLGLVTPGRPFEVKLDKLPPLQPNQLFEITLEPEQGSPIGRPTGPILFIGRAVRTI